MKNKNHSPSYKKITSKSLLSSTIEYIKNDLKNEYTINQNSSKKEKQCKETSKNKEKTNPKQSKS